MYWTNASVVARAGSRLELLDPGGRVVSFSIVHPSTLNLHNLNVVASSNEPLTYRFLGERLGDVEFSCEPFVDGRR